MGSGKKDPVNGNHNFPKEKKELKKLLLN